MQTLGHILTQKKLISEAQLNEALHIASATKMRLGDVLITSGVIGYLSLYQALAEHYKLDFINLLELEPDSTLLDAALLDDYIYFRALPYLRHNDITYIATSDISDAFIMWAKRHYGEKLQFAITSPLDINRTIRKKFDNKLTHDSRMALFEAMPKLSAKTKATSLWKNFGFICFAIMLVMWWFFPSAVMLSIMIPCSVMYALTMVFKLVIYVAGMHRPPAGTNAYPPVSDAELPIYTVMIPMYKEPESLRGMLLNMQRLDYPAAKLDIKLVLEEDDHEMIAFAKFLKPRHHFDIVVVPPSQPRTKPKACNYALRFARGEFVTVYDADDRPDPDQLRKAVAMFRATPSNVVCLQARLNYYNSYDNWLTRCFSLEYGMLFNALLPGLYRLDIPIMLGGTSNHFSIQKLKELGEWDPYNVTEDADLGTRLALMGYQTMMLDSDTLEEAPNTLRSWLYQRGRWIKGYMQTWLVHMRAPITLYKSYRLHGFVGFQCFVALSSFSYLTAPLLWTIALVWMTNSAAYFPHWLYQLTALNLILNLTIHVFTAFHTAMRYRNRHFMLIFSAVTYPFYLTLHTFASYLALYQLLTKPYAWNKTTHGQAKTFAQILLTKTSDAG